MLYEVRFELRAFGDDGKAHFVEVVDAYAALERDTTDLLDSSFGFADSEHSARVDVELTVTAGSEDEALRLGSGCLRTAIHTAGGFTPDWDERPSGIVYRLTDEGVALIPV